MLRDIDGVMAPITESEVDARFEAFDDQIASLEADICQAVRYGNNEDQSIDVMRMDLADVKKARDDFEASIYDEDEPVGVGFAVKTAGMFVATFVLGASVGYYLGAAEAAAMIVGAK